MVGIQTVTNHAQIEFYCLKLYNGDGIMYECVINTTQDAMKRML